MYAAAYSGLADVYAVYGTGNMADYNPNEFLPLARQTAEKALSLDPSSAEAHVSLGWARMLYDFDWSGAEAEFTRGIQLDSTYALAYAHRASFYHMVGQFDRALADGQTAARRDPVDMQSRYMEGRGYFFTKQYAQATIALQQAVELNATDYLVRMLLGQVFEQRKCLTPRCSSYGLPCRSIPGHPGPMRSWFTRWRLPETRRQQSASCISGREAEGRLCTGTRFRHRLRGAWQFAADLHVAQQGVRRPQYPSVPHGPGLRQHSLGSPLWRSHEKVTLAGVDRRECHVRRTRRALLHGGAYQATITPKSGRARRGLGDRARVGPFDTDVDGLSGGNQPKIAPARWLAAKSRRRSSTCSTGGPRVPATRTTTTSRRDR